MWITYAEMRAQKLTKNEQKSAIIDHTNTFASKNRSKHCQIKILLIARKATYSVSVGQIGGLCATCCTGYALKSVDRGLQDGHFVGFPVISTPTTPNLYMVFASKLKLEFFRGIVPDNTTK